MLFMIVAGIIGIILIVSLVYVFSLPTDMKLGKRKHKKEEKVELPLDLTPKVEKLERVIASLKSEIEQLQKQERIKEKELEIERVKVAKLEEKLVQERGWLEKEKVEIDKSGHEIKKYKEELSTIQEDFNKEHALYLRLRSDFQELTKRHDEVQTQKRALELENAKWKSQDVQARQEIQNLRREVNVLSRAKEDATFVAKSDYTQLEKKLKEKDVEIERLKRAQPGL